MSFEMAVQSVCVVKGRGTVVSGEIAVGTVEAGDELVLDGALVRCLGVETFNGRKSAGDKVGVLVGGVDPDRVYLGAVLRGPFEHMAGCDGPDGICNLMGACWCPCHWWRL